MENGIEFDSSFKRNQPFIFQIGLRQVIPGWEIGLKDIKVGGKRKIKIPPNLAYGAKGAGNIIPPNATIIFDLDVNLTILLNPVIICITMTNTTFQFLSFPIVVLDVGVYLNHEVRIFAFMKF